MKQQKETPSKYFQDALSDFVYDAASGRAIRHLADTGYTTAQIVRQLDYPTPFAKVQHTVTRHLMESGILLHELPVPAAGFQIITLLPDVPEKLYRFLSEYVRQNGEEYSYVSCPFGIPGAPALGKSPRSALTGREAEYLEGIAWEPKIMYHRLNRRMLEISVQLAAEDREICFYFLKSGEMVKFALD
ncbi:MAG: hypothetical protein K2N87_09685 [Eubacterium sp.]|nr:hypothetical protein [Eubacterium sp.]